MKKLQIMNNIGVCSGTSIIYLCVYCGLTCAKGNIPLLFTDTTHLKWIKHVSAILILCCDVNHKDTPSLSQVAGN
jgi:hypothetical protein